MRERPHFSGWLHPSGFLSVLEKALPHQMPLSSNPLTPLEKAVGFWQGILCEACKLTPVAYLRRDPLMPELLGVRRVPSQSTLSRFFHAFGGVAANAKCFRVLWNWTMKKLPSRREGYTLDLDSTKLLHEDGHEEGVKSGFTRQGIKPCLHPLLGILAEVRMVASFWLRAGNASCAINVISFVHDLLANLPSHIRLRGVRADSGFCVPELLEFLEIRSLPYVVVARLQEKIQTLLRSEMKWQPTEAPGMEVAETIYQAAGWKRARRLILIRHRKDQKGRRTGGKELFDLPEYLFQALVTSWPQRKDAVWAWRHYNKRADCENVIKELQYGFGISGLICERFHATEAALSLAVAAYNLTMLFQRALGWQAKVTILAGSVCGGFRRKSGRQRSDFLSLGPRLLMDSPEKTKKYANIVAK